MATTTVTGPDGTEYDVEHPDNATENQILEFAAQEFSGPVDFDAGTALSNIPNSGQQYLTDMWEGVKGLVQDTGVGVSRFAQNLTGLADEAEAAGVPRSTPPTSQLISGVAQHITGLADEDTSPNQSAEMVSAVGDYYGDRYGGVDELKKTAMNDPVGLLADVGGIIGAPLTGGASLLPKATKAGKIARTAAKAVTAIDPATYPTHLLNAVPTEFLYRKGMKIRGRDRADVLKTSEYGVERGLTSTDAGLAKTRKLAEEKLATRDKMLQEMPPVESTEIFSEVKGLEKTRGSVRGSVTPTKDVPDIKKAVKDYNTAIGAEYPAQGGVTPQAHKRLIPARDINDMKITLYKAADDAFGTDMPTAVMDTYKAIAKGAKQTLEKRNPRIKGVNEELGFLGNLVDTIEPGVSTAERRAIAGIDLPTRRLTNSDTAGLIASIVGQKSAQFATIVRQLRKNPAKYAAARNALIQTGRTYQEADRELQRLLEEEID
jgi:hypothetical protein